MGQVGYWGPDSDIWKQRNGEVLKDAEQGMTWSDWNFRKIPGAAMWRLN